MRKLGRPKSPPPFLVFEPEFICWFQEVYRGWEGERGHCEVITQSTYIYIGKAVDLLGSYNWIQIRTTFYLLNEREGKDFLGGDYGFMKKKQVPTKNAVDARQRLV